MYDFCCCYLLSHQSCPTLCDPRVGSPPGCPVPGILQARTLEWVAISFSSAWKWKVKVKSLSPVRLLATPWTAAYQAPPSMGFSRQEYWSGVPLLCASCQICLWISIITPSSALLFLLREMVLLCVKGITSFFFFFWYTVVNGWEWESLTLSNWVCNFVWLSKGEKKERWEGLSGDVFKTMFFITVHVAFRNGK